MKAIINNIKGLNKRRLDCLMLYAIVATIPFTISLGNLAIILAFVYVLFTSKKEFLKQLKKYPQALGLPLIYFLLILISALFSNDIKTGMKLVDKSLFFLLIPVSLIGLSKQVDYKKVLLFFAKSTFIATIILLLYSTFITIKTGEIDRLFFHSFTQLFDQHPVYFSIYQALSVFVLVKYKHIGTTANRLYLSMIAFLVLGIFLSASKIIISIFCVLFTYQLIKEIKKGPKRYLSITAFLGVIIILFTIPKLKTRFIEGFEYDLNFSPTNEVAKATVFNYEDKHLISDIEIRYIFNSIGLYHFFDDNKILFGYGTGDVQDYLDLYYMQYGLAPNWYEGYNIHNQYFQVLLSSGFFVFLFFLYYIFYNVKQALRRRDELSLFFLIIVLLVFFVESVLMRNKGVVVFVFFTSFFLIKNLKHEDSYTRNTRNS